MGHFAHPSLCFKMICFFYQVFKCHRTIMASASGFFKAELTSELLTAARKAGQPDVIVLDESYVKPEIFQDLLELIYRGKDTVHADHALEIMKAVIYLKIRSLEYRCLDVLVQGLGERYVVKKYEVECLSKEYLIMLHDIRGIQQAKVYT